MQQIEESEEIREILAGTALPPHLLAARAVHAALPEAAVAVVEHPQAASHAVECEARDCDRNCSSLGHVMKRFSLAEGAEGTAWAAKLFRPNAAPMVVLLKETKALHRTPRFDRVRDWFRLGVHPNLGRVWAVWRELQTRDAAGSSLGVDSCHYNILMQLYTGTLFDLMQIMRLRQWEPHFRSVRVVLAGILSGVAFFEENDFVHRDIKPQNVALEDLDQDAAARLEAAFAQGNAALKRYRDWHDALARAFAKGDFAHKFDWSKKAAFAQASAAFNAELAQVLEKFAGWAVAPRDASASFTIRIIDFDFARRVTAPREAASTEGVDSAGLRMPDSAQTVLAPEVPMTPITKGGTPGFYFRNPAAQQNPDIVAAAITAVCFAQLDQPNLQKGYYPSTFSRPRRSSSMWRIRGSNVGFRTSFCS